MLLELKIYSWSYLNSVSTILLNTRSKKDECAPNGQKHYHYYHFTLQWFIQHMALSNTFQVLEVEEGLFFFLSLLLIDSKSLIMKLPYYTTVQHMTWILTIGKGKSPWTDALNKTDCAFFSAFIFAERLSVLSFWQIFIFLFNCWLLLRSIFFICRSALKIRLKLMWWIGRSFLLDSLMAILLQVCKKTGKSWCDQSIFMFF